MGENILSDVWSALFLHFYLLVNRRYQIQSERNQAIGEITGFTFLLFFLGIIIILRISPHPHMYRIYLDI